MSAGQAYEGPHQTNPSDQRRHSRRLEAALMKHLIGTLAYLYVPSICVIHYPLRLLSIRYSIHGLTKGQTLEIEAQTSDIL